MGIDPLDCHICYEWESKEWSRYQIPFYFESIEEEYINMAPKKRLEYIINYNKKWNNIGYNNLSKDRKNRVFKIKFEELITNPYKICEDIADFLGTTTTQSTKYVLKEENCPR